MRNRVLGALATAAAFAGVVGAAAAPASASSWITPEQVHSITNPRTAVFKETPAGTVQVRYGTYGGVQYGWGRVVNPAAGYDLMFEVDTDGDRKADTFSGDFNISGGGIHWTGGYPTSSSSKVAFRACITKQLTCAETTYRTAWW
ncbi:hypothetical protein [Streptomyces barkulensis]|uniref:hypothetical protein n=1 Tax=Streptomyces barkulensis TaxID=1257026 RepID=UPI0019CFE3AB|nr:hypothetical protein [Streptomyces barkulensis]